MRHDPNGQVDDTPRVYGDRGWVGVNMRLEPHQLPPGYMSEAINARFRQGVPESRRGFVVPRWANKPPVSPSVITPWTAIHGVGIFSDPNTRLTYLVIAADNKVYVTASGNLSREVAVVGGTVSGRVTFTQAFDVM